MDNDEWDQEYSQWDWVEATHSYLKVGRARVSYPRTVTHAVSEWHHSLIPAVEDQETPHELPLVLTLRCLPRQVVKGHTVAIPKAMLKHKNITASEIRAARKKLSEKKIQGRYIYWMILDDLDPEYFEY